MCHRAWSWVLPQFEYPDEVALKKEHEERMAAADREHSRRMGEMHRREAELKDEIDDLRRQLAALHTVSSATRSTEAP